MLRQARQSQVAVVWTGITCTGLWFALVVEYFTNSVLFLYCSVHFFFAVYSFLLAISDIKIKSRTEIVAFHRQAVRRQTTQLDATQNTRDFLTTLSSPKGDHPRRGQPNPTTIHSILSCTVSPTIIVSLDRHHHGDVPETSNFL